MLRERRYFIYVNGFLKRYKHKNLIPPSKVRALYRELSVTILTTVNNKNRFEFVWKIYCTMCLRNYLLLSPCCLFQRIHFHCLSHTHKMDDIEIITQQCSSLQPPSTIYFTTVHASSFMVATKICSMFYSDSCFNVLTTIITLYHIILHSRCTAAWNIKWAI